MAKPTRHNKRRTESPSGKLDQLETKLKQRAAMLQRSLLTPVEVTRFDSLFDANGARSLTAVVVLPDISMEGRLGLEGKSPYVDLVRDLTAPPCRLKRLPRAEGTYRVRNCGHLNAIRRLTAA